MHFGTYLIGKIVAAEPEVSGSKTAHIGRKGNVLSGAVERRQVAAISAAHGLSVEPGHKVAALVFPAAWHRYREKGRENEYVWQLK